MRLIQTFCCFIQLVNYCCLFLKAIAKVFHYYSHSIFYLFTLLFFSLMFTYMWVWERVKRVDLRGKLMMKVSIKGKKKCIKFFNPRQRITWLMGRWRPQQTARRHVNCRTHDHWHVERILRLIHLVLINFNILLNCIRYIWLSVVISNINFEL